MVNAMLFNFIPSAMLKLRRQHTPKFTTGKNPKPVPTASHSHKPFS